MIKLEDYCCVCGKRITPEYDRRQIGFRGENGDTPANICGSCDHRNNWFMRKSVSTCLRFVVTQPSRLFRRFDRGYYIAAKPFDALDWDKNDRIWLEVDRVYETRWDCSIEPERVRQAA